MTFFLSNTLESQMMSSGAFEIFYDGTLFGLNVSEHNLFLYLFLFADVPIWSKLATGRIPTAQELFTMIDNQSKFYSSDMFADTMHTIPGGSKL